MANLKCPACGTQVPEEAIVCPTCGSDLRTLAAPTARTEWSRDKRVRQATPGSYMLSGIALLVVAGVVGGAIGFDETAGVVAAVVIGTFGQILLLIGIIARGVQVGRQ